MEQIKKLKFVISEVNKLCNDGRIEVFNNEARELIDKCGRNELMAVGCKIIKPPTNIEYIELPYKGIDKKRIEKLFKRISETE